MKQKDKGALVITAAKVTQQFPDYTVREYVDSGSIPNWFIGVILALKDQMEENEKIVVKRGKIKIVKKTRWDKFKEWLSGL